MFITAGSKQCNPANYPRVIEPIRPLDSIAQRPSMPQYIQPSTSHKSPTNPRIYTPPFQPAHNFHPRPFPPNNPLTAPSPSLPLTLSTSLSNPFLILPTSTSASSSSKSSLCPFPKTVQLRAFTSGTSPLRGMMWKWTCGTTWAARTPAR